MKIKSHALVFSDFLTPWYKHWAKQLKQDEQNLDGYMLLSNKFWQNAVICQVLYERGMLKPGSQGIGFGVGTERLPALFAKLDVSITATDQDYRKEKAKHWSKGELATGLQSLNQFQICDSQKFLKQVEYLSADMNRIPSTFYNKYDFIWSNCALGHLGSIDAGLDFIENSLECLKPGGWAVHTTELNVLSDTDTVEHGTTVIFRLSDIDRLYKKLLAKGYKCSPLQFFLGRSHQDFRISMFPQFGNDYSKIQVGGHIATQVVLIIYKPKGSNLGAPFNKLRLKSADRKNLIEIKTFMSLNPNIEQLFISQNTAPDELNVLPLKRKLGATLRQNSKQKITIEYKNNSKADLYNFNGTLSGTHPTLLATTHPNDRTSPFADKEWVGTNKNRPSARLLLKASDGSYYLADRVEAGQVFAFSFPLNSNNLKPGTYVEHFGLVQEEVGWIKDTDVELSIKII